ncbi:MAG: TrkA C-terminal domain-containing protein [Desulfococcaceae bacterium]|jgi:hypothetical protein|nr:TrkA C-terminal domain-containing protein [Desulfococcaceae bacterium]
MLPVISLLLVLVFSMLVTRIATVALTHTGLPHHTARFQARSAFTGVGFTTSESEKLVRHPVRRKILMLLMLFGNAGIVTAVSSLIISFVDINRSGGLWIKIAILVSGLLLLWLIAHSPWIERRLSSLISRLLKRYADLEVRDYDRLLHLSGEYHISEMQVQPADWLANCALKHLELRNEGVAVLGITRKNGDYIGAPFGDTLIRPYDTLILYGRFSSIRNLDHRQKGIYGDIVHAESIKEQEKIKKQEGSAEKEENRDEK